MCLGGSTGTVPKAPIVTPAPTAAQVQAAAGDTSINMNKKTVAERQGLFGNLKTTPFGDIGFGASTVARFGKKAA